jgi:hypothetical protein
VSRIGYQSKHGHHHQLQQQQQHQQQKPGSDLSSQYQLYIAVDPGNCCLGNEDAVLKASAADAAAAAESEKKLSALELLQLWTFADLKRRCTR